MKHRFKISKKRIAKEIILFWLILVPIILALIYVTVSNAIYSNKTSQKLSTQEDIIRDFNQVKQDLSKIADISKESVNNKINSQNIKIDRQTFFETNYPEFREYFEHDPEGELPNLYLHRAISSNYMASIIETNSFWDNYINSLDIIYNRDKALLDKQTNVRNEYDFEKKVKLLYTKAFVTLIHQIEINESRLTEYKSRITSPKERKNIIFFLIISYLILIYPLRLLIISIIWSFKTLKE